MRLSIFSRQIGEITVEEGHRCLMGLENLKWLDRQESLSLFGRNFRTARQSYLDYLSGKVGVHQDMEGGGLIRSAGGMELILNRKRSEQTDYDSRILGEGEFVTSVFRSKRKGALVRKKLPNKEIWIEAVYREMGVSRKEISRKEKTTGLGSRVRAIVTYLLVECFGEKKIRIAERFYLDPSAITRLYSRGQSMLENDEKLKAKLLSLK